MNRQQCKDMLKRKECGTKAMTFSKDSCSYDGTPSPKYGLMQTQTQTGLICTIDRRRIIATKRTSPLFGTNCTAEQLECRQGASITVWEKDVISSCPYKYITTISKLESQAEDVLFDRTGGYAYKVTGEASFCEMKGYSTAEGLIITANASAKKLRSSEIELAITHRLLASEINGRTFKDHESINMVRKQMCDELAAFFNTLKDKDDYYEAVTLGTNKEVVVYVLGGLIVLPRCVRVEEIDLKEFEDKCYEDPIVEFSVPVKSERQVANEDY